MDLTYIFRLRDTVTIGAMVRVGVRGGIKMDFARTKTVDHHQQSPRIVESHCLRQISKFQSLRTRTVYTEAIVSIIMFA